jgi:hypothetical protein
MLAVGGYDEFTVVARFDVVLLHEPPNSFFPDTHATGPKFSPDSSLIAACIALMRTSKAASLRHLRIFGINDKKLRHKFF